MSEKIQVGTEGLIEVRYVGAGAGSSTHFGFFTGARYVGGGSRPCMFVDPRDLYGSDKHPGVLELLENGKPKFAIVEEKAADEPKSDGFGLNQLTVAEVKALKLTSSDDIETAVIEEMDGKNRKSVVEHLENLLSYD